MENSFSDIIQKMDWKEQTMSINNKREEDVIRALENPKRTIEDFKALISHAARPFLETMIKESHSRTVRRFGRTIQLYIPLYLSNVCENKCVYCGFNADNKYKRVVLNEDEVLREAQVIKSMGFEHILLVTGEAPSRAGLDYFIRIIRLLRPMFAQVSMEVQPLDEKEYVTLIEEGLHSVYVYQETYHKSNYKNYHKSGKKSGFYYRLETPERLGRAGIHKTGLGILGGLEDWRTDSLFLAHHLKFLQKNFWKTKYSISFPRLRPHQGAYQPYYLFTDKDLVQLIAAYRLLDEDVELALSTRESAQFRDQLFPFGVTSMSAGSSTEPGGYNQHADKPLAQFDVSDNRMPGEVAQSIKNAGYEAVWKDWDLSYNSITK